MQLDDFDFDLPDRQIARYPLPERSASRLLHLTRPFQQNPADRPFATDSDEISGLTRQAGGIEHRHFYALPELLRPNDLLVLNDTKVMPARLYGKKIPGGGKVEALIERILDERCALAHLKASHAPKPGTSLLFDAIEAEVVERKGDLFMLRFSGEQSVLAILDTLGHIPLPPYIDRADESLDKQRYQTVYAKQLGAVAAPTAGLHFDASIFSALAEKGVETAYITLHVGAGTFQPIRTETISEHKMHSEFITITRDTCDKIEAARARGGRIIAAGTTTVRALETAALASKTGKVEPYVGETDIFIYPGYEFRAIDAMITNFHLPRSTLLMLVCAFAGYDFTMAAYQEAVRDNYRFFSYGDAMFIE